MEFVTSLLNNPTFALFVNPQVFVAVLLALLVYRLVSPVIDYLNPFTMLINAVHAIKTGLFRRSLDRGKACFVGGSGSALKQSQ
ncbi:hypothetical protein JAB4_059250 (plasmid) [Janthinobacterium sp. HH102]|uniref:hypothetical protein n=1 Tax=Janthinobacterium sp. HH102 TaxID=1537274 RepID=UPI000874B8E4|nr:hypothetical protein [Janthinobacterium sp. HH102]QOU76425.1 hypothetical protein JAB4_059250 [Janthinobacterium sp. HH102]